MGRDGSQGSIDTENIYIEGDNLDALKLLQETYLGKVKMIYIDPPYNTGHDFIYNDDFSQKNEDYLANSGQSDEEGNRLVVNLESNGRFHTDWLNMIYPRLRIAKDLLSEDGAIFISIDDHEINDLLRIGDEIFGCNRDILIWNKEADGKSGTLKTVVTTRRIHEYIVCYYKNLSKVQFLKVKEALKGREGEFQTANLAINLEKENPNHPNYFSITNPSGDVFTRQWKWNKSEIQRLIDENLIYWGSDGHKQPRLIIPLDERRQTYLLSILNYGGTTVGRKDFECLMGTIEFSYPKPVLLLYKLLSTASYKESIILDFFSGSSTTAHALMQLNAEDAGNRKFIMVQLPEKCSENTQSYKSGYKTICDIGEERIRRAGKIIKEQHPETNIDIGFRVFKVDSSNMNDVFYKPDDYNQNQIDLFADNIKEDRTSEDLLFQVMLDLGIYPSSKIEEKSIDGKKVFEVADGYLIACFDKEVTEDIVKAIAQKQPYYAVFRDSGMSSDSVATNFEQIFETYSPQTQRRIL